MGLSPCRQPHRLCIERPVAAAVPAARDHKHVYQPLAPHRRPPGARRQGRWRWPSAPTPAGPRSGRARSRRARSSHREHREARRPAPRRVGSGRRCVGRKASAVAGGAVAHSRICGSSGGCGGGGPRRAVVEHLGASPRTAQHAAAAVGRGRRDGNAHLACGPAGWLVAAGRAGGCAAGGGEGPGGVGGARASKELPGSAHPGLGSLAQVAH